MKMIRAKLLSAIIAFLLVSMTASYAQSTDRDNPTLLGSRIIKLNNSKSNAEYFYSFIVEKGNLNITVDGKMNYTGGIIVTAESSNGDFIDNFSASAYGDKTFKESHTWKFARRQRVILKLETGEGNFKLRIDGIAYREKNASAEENDPDKLPLVPNPSSNPTPKKTKNTRQN